VLLLAAALLLVPRLGQAQAQTPQAPQTQNAAPQQNALTGQVDFGGLFTTTSGDEARYERYRDTRDGAFSDISIKRASTAYRFNASAYHIGYRDQRYDAGVVSRRVDFTFNFTSIPLNYSYITSTPYTTNGSVLSLPDAAQSAVQGPTTSTTDGAVGVPCAPGGPPASCGNPTQAAQALANRSIYTGLANQFDLQQLRQNAVFAATFTLPKAFDVDTSFKTSGRTGAQPFGGSFAFNTAVEIPLPLDQRTNDATIGASWADDKSSVRVAWDGSWFTNRIPSVTWDNPDFLTNFNNGKTPPDGPYDPSAYSNGNGAAQGRLAEAPSNYMNVLGVSGMHKLPAHTTLNGTVQVTDQKQNEALIPWTTNQLVLQPSVFAIYPGLTQLPRPTAEAEARGLNALINMSSRPSHLVNFTVRYRYNMRDVRTPIFDATDYVRFDGAPSTDSEGFSPQFDNSRHNFDANASFTPTAFGTLRVGYGHEQIHREGRGFADVGENVFRVSYDAYSNQYVSIRGSYDYGRRRGSGYVEAESGDDTGPGGTQPTLRYYDEADRNRNRGSVVFTVMPVEMVDLYFQFSGIKDEYLPDSSAPVSRPGELFGLQESVTTSWNVGLNVNPHKTVSLGANYGRDKSSSFQKSRNANPPPDPTWTDPSRDWTLDNADHINNFTTFIDVLRAIKNTDIRFTYDYSDSDNSYGYGGPRIASLTSAGQFIPLPDVTNAWHRLIADVQYYFVPKVGVGFGWYYEKLDISDYNTIDSNGSVGFTPATGVPRIDYLGELSLGYGNRPYKGNTGTIRLIYKF
jgi:MtrB/PioB family decaheme-associated outer membrane protein